MRYKGKKQAVQVVEVVEQVAQEELQDKQDKVGTSAYVPAGQVLSHRFVEGFEAI